MTSPDHQPILDTLRLQAMEEASRKAGKQEIVDLINAIEPASDATDLHILDMLKDRLAKQDHKEEKS